MRGTLEELKGVKKVHASIIHHTATVTYNDRIITVDDIIAALNNDGFSVSGEPEYLK